jgi:DNA-binding transcriptional ArsR family regulator
MSRAEAKKKDERLDAVFHALADTTRRRIVDRLARGSISVGELASPFSISLAAISKHLDVLEDAGVVRREREGRFQRCRLAREGLDEVSQFVEHYRSFWTDTLDQLALYVEGDESRAPVRRPSGGGKGR